MSATPSSMSLTEKKRLFEETKYNDFEEISKDKSLMFNYFLQNNDIFRMISEEDDHKFRAIEQKCENERANVFVGSLATIFLIDQVVLKYAFPTFRLTKWRLTANLFKFLVLPSIVSLIYKEYFMGEYQIFFYNLQEKYAFGFNDYMKATKIYERALQVDRLDQLLEKREEFDWTGIPELPEDEPKTQSGSK